MRQHQQLQSDNLPMPPSMTSIIHTRSVDVGINAAESNLKRLEKSEGNSLAGCRDVSMHQDQ